MRGGDGSETKGNHAICHPPPYIPKVWRDGDVDVIQRYHLTRQHLVELKVPFPQDGRVLALQLGPLNVLHLGM